MCFFLRKKLDLESSKEADVLYYLSADLWKNDALTDPGYSNDLQKTISNIIDKCCLTVTMIDKSLSLTSYIDQIKAIHKARHNLMSPCFCQNQGAIWFTHVF